MDQQERLTQKNTHRKKNEKLAKKQIFKIEIQASAWKVQGQQTKVKIDKNG